MEFKQYLDYRCINLSALSERSGICRKRFMYRTAPNNLKEYELEVVKSIIGDWETFEPEGSNENQE